MWKKKVIKMKSVMELQKFLKDNDLFANKDEEIRILQQLEQEDSKIKSKS